MTEVMVVAGEASGDLHAAKVVNKLKELQPDIDFFGLGGEFLQAEGVDIIYDPTEISTIGFIEGLKNFRLLYQVLNQLTEAAKNRSPEVALLVDYSYFNMKVAQRMADLEIPVVDYFAPSAWVWGQWRAHKMAQYGAKIASVFPMEAEVYRQAGADVEFVGHPLVDMVDPQLSQAEFKEQFNLNLAKRKVVGLLPGSRQQEVKSLLSVLLEAARLINNQYSKVKFLLPVAKTISQSRLEEKINNYDLDISLIADHSYEVMVAADILLTASGTATLEAACLQTPMVIAYQTSWSTYLLGKLLVKIPYVGLPNIILNQEVVPELLQQEVTGQNLAQAAVEILDSTTRYQKIKQDLAQVKDNLGAGGAVKRVAELVLATGGIEYGVS